MTSQEKLEKMLLSGVKVDKGKFYREVGTFCLTQRIYDIKKDKGWLIRSRTVDGKGTLREYWLDKDEIERIKATQGEKPKVEQSSVVKETAPKQAEIEPQSELKAEQGSLGLFGEPEWWY